MTEPVAGPDRRAKITAQIQAETGIDEEMIERLVRSFYRRVREDDVLGPVFAAKIVDWEPHLQRMCAFWSSVALMSGRYHGQPMQAHLPLPVAAQHFDRWLAIFEASAREECPPQSADRFLALARRIAESSNLASPARMGFCSARESAWSRSPIRRESRRLTSILTLNGSRCRRALFRGTPDRTRPRTSG